MLAFSTIFEIWNFTIRLLCDNNFNDIFAIDLPLRPLLNRKYPCCRCKLRDIGRLFIR